jgi:hypothetical protein
MNKEAFYRDPENYILVGNKIYRREYSNPHKLNMEPINKDVFKGKFRFTDRHYEELQEYTGFECKPSHIDYQQIVNGDKWNTYERIDLNPKPGEWPTIKKLIEHLYGDNGVEHDQTEVLYDVHTLMLLHPEQSQYVRILYSLIQGTAKTSLGTLESMIFKGNYTKIRDEEMEDKFNELWGEALIIHMDEPMFAQKQKMSRKIRDMATQETINIRRMQTAATSQPFFAKFLITTNDTNFMPIEKSDRRYWVREVPAIAEEDKDPHFIDKMRGEIDHYVHFLMTRKMKYPEKIDSTFWLPNSITRTAGFKTFVEDNTSSLEQQIEDWFYDYFLERKHFDHLTFTAKDIQKKINWEEGKTPSTKKIGIVLRDVLGLTPPTNPRKLTSDENYIIIDGEHPASGRFWTIYKDQIDGETNIFDLTKITK